MPEDDLLAQPITQTIDRFFLDQNLTLPPGREWRTVSANIFRVVDGKRIIFENDDALFQLLKQGSPSVQLIRENVAVAMTEEEIHEDVRQFFEKLKQMVEG